MFPKNPISIFLAVIYLASLVLVFVSSPDGIQLSADENAQNVPLWAAILPSFAGIALVLLLSLRPQRLAVREVHRENLLTSTAFLIALAVLFPVICILFAIQGENYILAKFIMLMVIPAAVVMRFRRAIRIESVRAAWRWWAPAIVIVVWTLLSQVAPWNPEFDTAGLELGFIIAGTIATAITAGIGEELFYRKWLQSRLEALLGSWTALGLASLSFALMHLATHGTGDFLKDSASAIVFQGTFGFFLGLMWIKYRNLAAIILLHLIINGWGVVAALLP